MIHPSYWFSSREAVSLVALLPYFIFLFLLVAVAAVLIFFQFKSAANPFKKRFFQSRFWWLLLFLLVASCLTFFRFQGFSTLSARALWLPYSLALLYFAYFSFVEFSKKIPEKTSKYEENLVKKRYLRAFRKKR